MDLSHLPGAADFERFRALVLRDPALLRELRAAPGIPEFLELAVRLGAERGLYFTAAELRAAMAQARREWQGL